MLYYLIVLVVIVLIGSNKKWDLKKKVLLIMSFLVLCVVLFFIALILGFDRGREPLNVEEVIDLDDNVEELTLEEEDNGDGKRGYVYRKLVKERSHFLLDMFRIKSSYGLYTTPF